MPSLTSKWRHWLRSSWDAQLYRRAHIQDPFDLLPQPVDGNSRTRAPEQRVLCGLGVSYTTAAYRYEGDNGFSNEGMFLQERMYQHEILM